MRSPPMNNSKKEKKKGKRAKERTLYNAES